MNNKEIIITCPHCSNIIIIYKKDINCAIFRHGVFISSLEQIDPHTSKILCEKYIREKKIYGCGKPFIIKKNDINYYTEICAYI
jgi:hypothetical protein